MWDVAFVDKEEIPLAVVDVFAIEECCKGSDDGTARDGNGEGSLGGDCGGGRLSNVFGKAGGDCCVGVVDFNANVGVASGVGEVERVDVDARGL